MNFDDFPIPHHVELARALFGRLQPGQEVQVSCLSLDEASIAHVLEGIPGSAYRFGYIKPFTSRDDLWVLFALSDEEHARIQQDNHRTYVSLDRQHLFSKVTEKLWKFNS